MNGTIKQKPHASGGLSNTSKQMTDSLKCGFLEPFNAVW